MKKTKLYAKKTLSVFMAVMMLMTAWVFVAPEKASAYPDSASTVSAANQTALNSIPSFNTDVTTITDLNWAYNGDNQENEPNVYKNILYASDCNVATANTGSVNLKDSSAATIQWYHGTYIFLYDGVTTPQAGVMVAMYPKGSSYNIRMYSSYIAEGAGLNLAHNWYASDGRANFMWVISAPGNQNAATKDGSINSTYCWTVNSNTWFANKLQFTGSMSDTEYYKDITVTWGWKGNQKSQGTGNVYTYTAKAGNHVYVVNYKPLKAALNEALGTGTYGISTLKNNLSKYTTASVAEYVAAVKDLIDAKPNNYVNSSSNNYTGYANAASAAVTRFNNAKANLTLQTYRISFEDKDGNIGNHYYSRDYGTTVNLAELAQNHPNTLEKGNENGHQTYTWGNLSTSHTVTDDMIIKETASGVVAHTYGAYTQTETQHSRTCSVCGYVQTQNHTRGTGYVTKEETCTEDGVMTYDCATCGKTAIETSVINNITGHNFTGDAIENVTGENGNHWKKCSRCDAYGWNSTENACEDHNWDKNDDGSVNAGDAVTVASTCHSQGSETYTCKVCNATWTKTLDYASHTITATAKKDVTNLCGGDGNEAFWSCSVCNRVWKDAELTDELTDKTDADSDGIPDALETKGPDHKFTGPYASVSEGVNGTHHRQCVNFTQCKTYGPEEKHTWGDPAVTDATCEKAGKKVYTCTSGCGQTYEETIEKVAHSMTKHDAVEAKCGVAGSIEYYSCSICGKNYSDANGTTVVTNTVVPALEHKWTAHHDYDTLKTPATCMAAAVYNNHCDYCKVQIIGAEHSYGEKDTVNGHNFNGEIVKNADGSHSYKCTVAGCTEAGKKTTCSFTIVEKDVPSTCHTLGYTITKCEICGNEKREDKTAYDFNNHDGETEVRFATEAKCNTNGYTGDTYCLGCSTKIATGTAIIADKTVHPHEDMKVYEAQPATCQTAGWKEYKYCSACGTYEVAKATIPVKAHKFTTYTSNGNGTHTATCDTCDASVATPVTDTQPCTGGKANCQSGAICTVCNTAYGEEDENNHVNKVFVPEVPATCQKEGTEAYYKCADCGVAIGTVEKLEKLPHVYSAWISNGDGTHTKTCSLCDPAVADPATETEDCNGGTAYCDAKAKCADCKAEYGEKNPVNHSTEANHLVGYVKETCQAPGYTGDYHYDCCNALKQQGEEIAQLAHTFSIEVEGSRTAATCIAKGEVTYKCSTCVESEGVTAATQKKELAVDANNHAGTETKKVNDVDATCESDGYTGDIYYSCCYDETKTEAENKKALKEKGTVIKANGQHVYQTAVPEYMLELDEDGKAVIVETEGEDGKPVKSLKVKATEPDYAAKIAARHADDKWYHVQICSICDEIVYSACYTYAHTYNCVDTDKCEVCKGLCSLKDADKHDELEKIEGKAATHTEDGTKAYYKCKDCGKFFLDDAGKKEFDPESAEGKKLLVISKDTVPCTSWEKEPFETVEPKCGKDGYKKYHCTIEGCTKVKTEIIPAEGETHVWSADYKEIKAPTCGAVGYEARYCTLCGEIKPNSAVTIDPTGEHNYDTDKNGTVDINDAEVVSGVDCQHPGTITYTCVVCGNKEVETDTSGVSAHQWSANEGDEGWVVVGGDCSTGVSYQRTCLKCNATEQKFVSGGDHEYEVYKYEAPTPEKDGYVIYECVNCKFRTEPEVLKYAGGEGEEPDTPPVTPEEPEEEHIISADNYIVVEDANCEHAELREYTCLDCGEKVRYYVGETKPHVWLSQAAEQATCSRDGHNEYYRCVRCLAEYGRENYPATGHVDGNGDGKCDECSSAFYEGEGGTGICSCMCHKTGFMAFIFKIVNFFWKLFKINPSCACGNTHY